MKKKKHKAKIWGALVVTSLVASYAWAQTSDDEIIKMLDKKVAAEKATASESAAAEKAAAEKAAAQQAAAQQAAAEKAAAQQAAAQQAAAQQAAAEKAAAEKAAAEKAAAEKAAAEKAAAQQAAAEKAAAEKAAAEKAAAEKAAAQQAAAEKAAAEKAAAEKAAAEKAAAQQAAAQQAAAKKAAAEKAAAQQAAAEKAAAEKAAAEKAAAEKAAAEKAAAQQAAAEKAAEVKEPAPAEVKTIAADEPKVEAVTKKVDSAPGKGSMDDDDRISLTLENRSLQEAVSLFAQISGANIIVPDLTEASTISVTLKDVNWHSALQSILDTYNYELFQKVAGSNIYTVRRRPAGAPAPQLVETFILRYATVPNVAKLVRDLLKGESSSIVTEFASRNMLVVKASESSINEVRKVIRTIDIVRQQVFIESKFMELSDGAQKDLGLDWKQLGMGENGGGLTASVGETHGGSQLSYTSPAAISEHLFTSVLDVQQLQVVLNALETTKGANLVSNPKIIVANEETANIKIIQKQPNIEQESKQAINDSNDTVTYSLNDKDPFFEYGITLDVTPSINTASNITVKIKPVLSRKNGEINVTSGKDGAKVKLSYPIIDEKSVDTTFSLANGQTAAIGGLTEVFDKEEERKVPLLGYIPYLGRLFSWKETINKQTETIIFVTVALADTQEIRLTTGFPGDSELARQRLIRDRETKKRNEYARKYYEEKTARETEAAFEKMDAKENARLQKIADEKAAAARKAAAKKAAAARKAAEKKAAAARKVAAQQAAADKAAADKAAKKAASQQPKGEKK